MQLAANLEDKWVKWRRQPMTTALYVIATIWYPKLKSIQLHNFHSGER